MGLDQTKHERNMEDVSLRKIQTSLPWTIRYSRDYRANPQPHKDFAHALVHVGKALGKLLGLVDDMDHDREVADDPALRDKHGKYLADLVVCALRAANTFPGGVLDLESAVIERIREKNTAVAEVVPKIDAVTEGEVLCSFCKFPKMVHVPKSDPLAKYFGGCSDFMAKDDPTCGIQILPPGSIDHPPLDCRMRKDHEGDEHSNGLVKWSMIRLR